MMYKSFICLLLSVSVFMQEASAQTTNTKWYKGNIHVHTNRSDGKSSPDSVVQWYRERGYDFLVITDHNMVTKLTQNPPAAPTTSGMLVLTGEEISDRLGKKPVHLGAIGIDEKITPAGGNSVAQIIEANTNKVVQMGGLSILNHPNGLYSQSIQAKDLIEAAGIKHFEVCCADYKGGSGKPSTDEIWDSVLTTGKLIYGVTGDDAHSFEPFSNQPGTAWIILSASSLHKDAILEAMRKGAFYASTGVVIKDVAITNTSMTLELENNNQGFITYFIGEGGRILKKDLSDKPMYTFNKRDGYVRARIERSDGTIAWVQPIQVH